MAVSETEPAVDTTGDVDDRDRRAATEAMAVMPLGDDRYQVYSGERADYLVDLREPACECSDWEYRSEQIDYCKHLKRVRQTLGVDPIPDGVRVDPTLPRQRERLVDGKGVEN